VTLLLIGLVGGFITGISPCVLPVLPVIFVSGGMAGDKDADGRSGPASGRRPFLVVAGLAISFSLITLLGTVILDALPIPADALRWAGLVVLALLGLALGAVYVPCAGPVLAAITVAGATGHARRPPHPRPRGLLLHVRLTDDPRGASCQRRMAASEPAVTSRVPSAENAIDSTLPWWVSRGGVSAAGPAGRETSQKRTVPSALPIASSVPSGETALHHTASR
jgi:hypothetical protein